MQQCKLGNLHFTSYCTRTEVNTNIVIVLQAACSVTDMHRAGGADHLT